MAKREHLKQELENLINEFILNRDEDCPTYTDITFSVHQSQGLNIEDFEIVFQFDPELYDTTIEVATGEETHFIEIEVYCTYQTRLLQEETITKEKMIEFIYPYTSADSIDNLIDLVETKIQELTQWNSENTVEISILDLPYIPLKNPFTDEEEYKPSVFNEFGIIPIIPEEEPIILFDEDGNHIKY